LKLSTAILAFAAIVGAMVATATTAAAQNNITQQKVGDFVYFGGTYDGQPVTGTAQRIGNFVYYNLTVGGVPKSWSEQVVGQQTYRTTPDGPRAARRRLEARPTPKVPLA
jgi:hypothetical protein